MIPLFKVIMHPKAQEYVKEVLDSGYIGEGPKTKELERRISDLFGYKEIKVVNSATSALDIALHMIGIDPGDEVITTPITCTATNSNAANRGAKLVWADVNPITGLIDPEDVAEKITERTKAIIAVNWGGKLCNYSRLRSFGIPVIEDAAHGPYWSDETRGNFIVWSFQAIKHLTMGDGGALWSNDPKRVRLLRWYGLDRESSADFRCAQNIQEIGYKYQSNDILSAIGLANLEGLDTRVAIHNSNAMTYDRLIKNPRIVKPIYDINHPFWLYTILTENRDGLKDYLHEHGIASSQVHARNDKHDAFRRVSKYDTYADKSLKGVEFFDSRQLSIPVGSWVTYEDITYISGVLNRWEGI